MGKYRYCINKIEKMIPDMYESGKGKVSFAPTDGWSLAAVGEERLQAQCPSYVPN